MRQLVAIRALNVNHPNKPKMQRYQSRRGLLTLTKWIISQLIICLPACSKLTVTFMPTIDCTWPCPQSGWFGCATKSPRLKYNICPSHCGRLCCPCLSPTTRNCICKNLCATATPSGQCMNGALNRLSMNVTWMLRILCLCLVYQPHLGADGHRVIIMHIA